MTHDRAEVYNLSRQTQLHVEPDNALVFTRNYTIALALNHDEANTLKDILERIAFDERLDPHVLGRARAKEAS